MCIPKIQIFFVLSIFFISLSIDAATPGPYTAKIYGATVYLQGAELSSRAEVNLVKGDNTVVITGISPYIDPNSIRLIANKEGIINSVRHNISYLRESNTELYQLYKDSLDNLNKELSFLRSEQEVLKHEGDMLRNNFTFKSTSEVATGAALKEYSDIYRKRSLDIAKRNIEINYLMVDLHASISRVSSEMNKYSGNGQPSHEIIVDFTSDRSQKSNFMITYNISTSGWTPTYDLYIDDNDASLIYKGVIRQESGIDWEDIDLRLSTTRPSYNNTAPQFKRMYVDVERVMNIRGSRSESLSYSDSDDYVVTQSQRLVSKDAVGNVAKQRTFEQIDNGLDIVYEVPKKYTIKNGEREKYVTLQDREIQVDKRYLTIPRFSEKVYLIADLERSLASELVSGMVSVFYNGGYTGRSYLDMASSDDKVSVTVSADDRVKVKRRLLRDFQEDKFLSSDIEKFYAYEITLENNKKEEIEVELVEMLPLSQSELIEVDLIESSGAKINRETGLVEWKIKLDPLSKETRKFIYSLRYPKDMRVNTLFRD